MYSARRKRWVGARMVGRSRSDDLALIEVGDRFGYFKVSQGVPVFGEVTTYGFPGKLGIGRTKHHNYSGRGNAAKNMIYLDGRPTVKDGESGGGAFQHGNCLVGIVSARGNKTSIVCSSSRIYVLYLAVYGHALGAPATKPADPVEAPPAPPKEDPPIPVVRTGELKKLRAELSALRLRIVTIEARGPQKGPAGDAGPVGPVGPAGPNSGFRTFVFEMIDVNGVVHRQMIDEDGEVITIEQIPVQVKGAK